MGQITSNLLKKAFATWQHAFLSASTSMTFLLGHAQKSNLTYTVRPFCFCFLLQWLTSHWARKHHPDGQIYMYHGVAICSRRQFCSEFSSQISEHFHADFRLHWANHSFLGIIRKISSGCKTWVQMMLILVKGNDIRSETKANAHHRQLWPERQSVA